MQKKIKIGVTNAKYFSLCCYMQKESLCRPTLQKGLSKLGMSIKKSLARSYVRCPIMDREIQE